MKKILLITFLGILSSLFAQDGDRREGKQFSQRFNELEKIKLLEILDLEEDAAVKFFSRRKKVKKNIEELKKESQEIYDKIEEALANKNESDDYISLIKNSLDIEKQIIDEKSKYIFSLNDILTREQVLQVILFERKFKKDVRSLLIERGRKKFKQERFNN